MSDSLTDGELGVAEVKARFSEIIDRVSKGERIVVSRHGRPVLALVRPDQARVVAQAPIGLAAVAGALDDWDDLPAVIDELYRARAGARSRPAPELD